MIEPIKFVLLIRLKPREIVSYKREKPQPKGFERAVLPNIAILKLKNRINKGKATKLEQKIYLIMDNIVYYLYQSGDELEVKLYIQSH